MSEHSAKLQPIPFNSLAEGIFHGPYPSAPKELIDYYLQRRHEHYIYNDDRSDEEVIIKVQSEWQADQHAEAVQVAATAPNPSQRITQHHANFMLTKVLELWFYWPTDPEEQIRLGNYYGKGHNKTGSIDG